MAQSSYKNKKINDLLELLKHKRANGILSITSLNNNNNGQFSNVLIWKDGGIVYGSSALNSPLEIVKKLLQKLNPKMTKTALKFTMQKVDNSSSLKVYLSFLTKIGALKWSEIETYIQKQVACIIEQIGLFSGTAHFQAGIQEDYDFSLGKDEHSLDWSKLFQELQTRQQKWHLLSPEICSPKVVVLPQYQNLESINQKSIREHIDKYINGKSSLIEIAKRLEIDPLNIARTYRNWLKFNWIACKKNTNSSILESTNSHLYNLEFEDQPNQLEDQPDQLLEEIVPTSTISGKSERSNNLPTILSVDDSLIVQASIKRVLQDKYNLLFNDNALDAFQTLEQNKIDLLLLDVIMPEINGLEMCKILRKKPQFKNLPIIMVTARDKLADRLKGKSVGTDYYLAKPFDPAKLKQLVNYLLQKQDIMSHKK